MRPVIEVDHVTKEFKLGQMSSIGQSLHNGWRRVRGLPAEERAPFKALDDVSFTVQQGEVLGIIGHNGAGKSTLLKLLADISQPTRGTVRVHERVAPLIEVGAGMVPDMTGRENIYLNASILGMRRAEIRRKFDEIVAFSEIEDFIDTPVKRYSSGMQVKLGFSIATAVEAPILIVDEVLAVGDLAFQRKCFDRMESLIRREGRTVLLVSHNIRQVERICTRALMLDHGVVASHGEPTEVCGAFYAYSDRRIVGQTASARQQTSGQIELRALRMLDGQGRLIEQAQTGQPLVVELEFEARECLDHPIFGLGIHTTDLLYLSTEITEELFRDRRIEPGVFVARATIPRLPLLPGAYSFRVGVNAGEVTRNIFYGENLSPLLVASPETRRSQASTEGFFELNAQWNLSGSVERTARQEMTGSTV